jgi:hypothetical protein
VYVRHLAEESSRIRSHLDAAVTAEDSSSRSPPLFKETGTDRTAGRGRDYCARRGSGYWQEPLEVPLAEVGERHYDHESHIASTALGSTGDDSAEEEPERTSSRRGTVA